MGLMPQLLARCRSANANSAADTGALTMSTRSCFRCGVLLTGAPNNVRSLSLRYSSIVCRLFASRSLPLRTPALSPALAVVAANGLRRWPSCRCRRCRTPRRDLQAHTNSMSPVPMPLRDS